MARRLRAAMRPAQLPPPHSQPRADIVLPRARALADAKDAVAAFEAFTPHGHGGSLSNQSHVTSNRVSDATTRILKISDQRPAREIGRLRPIRPSQTHRPLTICITA